MNSRQKKDAYLFIRVIIKWTVTNFRLYKKKLWNETVHRSKCCILNFTINNNQQVKLYFRKNKLKSAAKKLIND